MRGVVGGRTRRSVQAAFDPAGSRQAAHAAREHAAYGGCDGDEDEGCPGQHGVSLRTSMACCRQAEPPSVTRAAGRPRQERPHAFVDDAVVGHATGLAEGHESQGSKQS